MFVSEQATLQGLYSSTLGMNNSPSSKHMKKPVLFIIHHQRRVSFSHHHRLYTNYCTGTIHIQVLSHPHPASIHILPICSLPRTLRRPLKRCANSYTLNRTSRRRLLHHHIPTKPRTSRRRRDSMRRHADIIIVPVIKPLLLPLLWLLLLLWLLRRRDGDGQRPPIVFE